MNCSQTVFGDILVTREVWNCRCLQYCTLNSHPVLHIVFDYIQKSSKVIVISGDLFLKTCRVLTKSEIYPCIASSVLIVPSLRHMYTPTDVQKNVQKSWQEWQNVVLRESYYARIIMNHFERVTANGQIFPGTDFKYFIHITLFICYLCAYLAFSWIDIFSRYVQC